MICSAMGWSSSVTCFCSSTGHETRLAESDPLLDGLTKEAESALNDTCRFIKAVRQQRDPIVDVPFHRKHACRSMHLMLINFDG